MTSIESYKDSIAEKYVEDFKKELKFFERVMVLPLSKKMKEVLKSNKKIDVNGLGDLQDLWFWRNVLWVKIWDKQLFESLVDKTFSFLKEKQEKIIQAETEWKLGELLNLVINWKLDNFEQRVNNDEWTRDNDEWMIDNDVKTEDAWNRSELLDVENNEDRIDSDNEWNAWTNVEWDNKSWENKEINSVVAWTTAWTVWAVTYYEGISVAEKKLWINKLKEAPKEFDASATKKMMENISSEMGEKLKSPKLNKAQRRVYEKSIKEFKAAAESLDWETVEAFKAYQQLQDRLPTDLWEIMNYDMKTLRSIENLPDGELVTIVGKDEKAIMKFFDAKWIKVSEDLARQLKVAKNVSEIRWLAKILKNWTKLANVLKWIKGMWVVTVLFAWFDVWCYLESKKEAELISKVNEVRWEILRDQATMQLIIWMWSVLLEAAVIVAACVWWWSLAGPWWTVIWVVVWIIAAAASIWYDELYANKKEFYAQNRYDFINQRRTKIKQSIVQLFESDRLGMDSWMKETIKDDRWPNSEIDTMEDSWEALIYQEEVYDGWFYMLPMYYSSWESEAIFKKSLSKEQIETFEKEKKDMENIIETRKEYIKQYLDKKNPAYNQLKQAIESRKSLEFVEQILADSKVYAYIKSQDDEPYIQNYNKMKVSEYKNAYKKKLSEEYPTEFEMFEKLRKENPNHLQEICAWFMASKWIIEFAFESEREGGERYYSEEEIPIMKKNIDFLTKYNTYRNLGTPLEKQVNSWVVWTTFDYKYIEELLLDINSINRRSIWEKGKTINYLSCYEFIERENIENQVSDSIFQNILYSIAREIHWYDWENNQFSLIQFYSWDGNDTWIYYDKCWKINIDGLTDRSLEWIELNKLTKDELKKKMFWWEEVWVFYWDYYQPEWWETLHSNSWELDSPVEAADDQLNDEFKKRVEAIIDREYWYRENKSVYEKKIIDFIKNNNQWKDWYVEIPEYLAIEAKKAWLWNVYKYLFKIENGQIYALSRGDIAQDNLHFDNEWKKIKYEVVNKLRQKNGYTQEEKHLMDYVDAAEHKLQKVMAVQWKFLWISQHEDDLDIPVELERIVSQKSIEWNQVKESILYMDWVAAKKYLERKSEEYFHFFNWMYVWILNQVTGMKASNDMDGSAYFYGASCFIGWNAVRIKESNWKKDIEINESVNESIRSHLKSLLGSKDPKSWKKINELILSDDEKEQGRWMSLANNILELCLEKAVLSFDGNWKVTNISQIDFDNSTLEKVKKDLDKVLKKDVFIEVHNKYKTTDYLDIESKFSVRSVEKAETDSHNEIKNMTAEIVDTMNNVDRASKRKNPVFEVDEKQTKEWVITWKFKSWWYEERVSVNMDWNKKIKSIQVDWLWMRFDSSQEWFRVANVINWIKHNVKENPKWHSTSGRMRWKYWYYQRSWWELERDVENTNFDVDILDKDIIDKYYPHIKESSVFLDYINNFM